MKDRQLESYYKRLDILDATAKQIIHDFELLGMEVSFSGDQENAYRELFDQILPHIEKILRTDSRKLIRVFQKIDLSEFQIAKLFKSDKSDLPVRLTDLIIKRELQKVVIRFHYKGRHGDDN